MDISDEMSKSDEIAVELMRDFDYPVILQFCIFYMSSKRSRYFPKVTVHARLSKLTDM